MIIRFILINKNSNPNQETLNLQTGPETAVGPVTRKALISKKEDIQVNALRYQY